MNCAETVVPVELCIAEVDQMCDNSFEDNNDIITLLYGPNCNHSKASVPRDEHLEIKPGTDISHYRIESLLGSGANGEVYVARDLQLSRQVAIKVLKYQSEDDTDQRELFLKEARAAASLNHPNIVTIYKISQFEKRPTL